MLRELGIRNAIYSPENNGPDEETFTSGMRNIVLQMAPTSLFGSLVAILPPHLGQRISKVTHTVADLISFHASIVSASPKFATVWVT